MRPIPAATLSRSLVWRTTGRPCVREGSARYEDEGSVREAHGAVPVGQGAWWSASLAVPIDEAVAGGPPIRLRLVRHGGEGHGRVPSADVELLLPAGELAAVVTLLVGISAQALRDGVLPGGAA